MRLKQTCVLLIGSFVMSSMLPAQQTSSSAAPLAAPPPATKLEGFKPGARTLVTLGYDELVAPGMFSGVSLDVREMRSAAGGVVRGLVAEVRESQYRTERAFVDADELPELLRGITALLDVKANPTVFKDFEVRYRTRGELEVSAYSSGGKIRYAISAGRVVRASRLDLSAHEIEALRSSIEQAQSRLASLPEK